MKRWISMLVALVMVLPLGQFTAAAEGETNGTCGESCTWSYADGVLTISGSGRMYDLGSGSDNMPWWDFKDEIRKAVVEEGVTYLGGFAFYKCSNLAEVSLPGSLENLGYMAFAYCTSLKKINLPYGLTRIAPAAFVGCTSLESVSIPETVTIIWEETFADCSSLSSVKLHENLEKILGHAFQGCAIEKIQLPYGLKSLSYNVFYGCDIKEITIPASVSDLDHHAFFGCDRLNKVTFMGSAPSVYDAIFDGALTVYYPADDSSWTQDIMDLCGGDVTWIPVGAEEKPSEEPQPSEDPEETQDPVEEQKPKTEKTEEPTQPSEPEPEQEKTESSQEQQKDIETENKEQQKPMAYDLPNNSGVVLLWGFDPLEIEMPTISEYLTVARLKAFLEKPA